MSDEEQHADGNAWDNDVPPERQVELRAAYEHNRAAGAAPYAGVRLRSRAELEWVLGIALWPLGIAVR